MSATLDIIIGFLKSIGIKVIIKPINNPAFLPGLLLENGSLIIDTEKLLFPGDILHEAGHLATMPPGIRETMSDNLEDNDLNRGGELMALAWSYAACVHLGIDPQIVFHPQGYKGRGEGIIQSYKQGDFIALPLLQWAGMAYDEKRAKEFNALPYPNMIRWLRENQ
jgi:hypothetical protein